MPGERARVMDDDNALEARLLFLERRIEGLSANLARLATAARGRGRTRMRGVTAAEPVSCPLCVASANPIAQASERLRNQSSAIGAMVRGIDAKAAELRAQSHEFRIMARKTARRASNCQLKSGHEDFDRAIEALALTAKAQVLRARAEAADAHAVLLRSQVRVLVRCAIQLQSESETLDREQARLDERVEPLRDWAKADVPGQVRRRM